MAVFKRVLCKERLRQVPQQFSWIDHRLVRDRHISRCSANALALYLFLVTVADGQGLSYYADATICRLLPLRQAPLDVARSGPLDAEALDRARRELIDNRLIAYQRPLYQVLALGPAQPSPRPQSSERRSPPSSRPQSSGQGDAQPTGPQSLAQIFKKLMESADPASDRKKP
jgi:hypothetical protein